MDEAHIEVAAAWLSKAGAALSTLRDEADGIMVQVSTAVDEKIRQDLLIQWRILAKGVIDLAVAAMETAEAIAANAKGNMPHHRA